MNLTIFSYGQWISRRKSGTSRISRKAPGHSMSRFAPIKRIGDRAVACSKLRKSNRSAQRTLLELKIPPALSFDAAGGVAVVLLRRVEIGRGSQRTCHRLL